MVDLRGKPFFLNDEDIRWVEETRNAMTPYEKTAQLFCVVSAGEDGPALEKWYAELPFGGVTFRPAPAEKICDSAEYIQTHVSIPLLISANLENGGSGLATDGTELGSQLEVAATDDAKYAHMLGHICGAEGSSIGCNYAFAPVVDIQFNWRNPIINTRTYGSDPERVANFGAAYLEGLKPFGVAASLKHFPGDGVDERDQHLVTSINSLSCEEWDASYGRVYKRLIDQGAQTVMVGHILMPAYSKKLNPQLKDCDLLPASISPELVTGLLRERLGFNGMIITDSAVMTGLGCALPRCDIPAAAINAGCDMFLFGRNLQEDFDYLWNDVQSGKVSVQRLDEAVTRVLALKASLGLHKKTTFTNPDYKKVLHCPDFMQAARDCADHAITLVKDTQKLLPLSPKRYKRILLHVLGDAPGFRGGIRCRNLLVEKLQSAGFEVTCSDTDEITGLSVNEMQSRYDLILYAANVVSGCNNTVNRIQWLPQACGQSPQYVRDIPTMFVSFWNPCHFVDVPMIRTIINCYNCSEPILDSFVDKLTGKSPFLGKNPLDPFCGMWGAEL